MSTLLNTATISALLLSATLSSSLSAADLMIKIPSVEEAAGTISMAVYDSEKNFVETVLIGANETAIKGDMSFSFPDLAAGEYAVMVYHDLNGNGKLDSNLLGMPKEPWGASLEGTRIFGAPTWEDTKFSLSEDGTTITIDLH